MARYLNFILMMGSVAFAFPEMVRHGYVNCTACHVSPNGGGVLTAYGRSLSKEVLSQFGIETESNFLWGALRGANLKGSKWSDTLLLGGDVRTLQIVRDTPLVREGRFIGMQADVEGALDLGQVLLNASVGFESPEVSGSILPISRRFWGLVRITDNLFVRLGKFDPSYGLKLPEHRVFIRSGLGLDQGSETYNAELSYLGENADLFLTVQGARIDSSIYNGEQALFVRSSRNLGDRSKAGLSALLSDRRLVVGPHVILGLTEHSYILGEIDSDLKNQKLYGYLKYGHEFIQGIHGYVKSDFDKDHKKFGIGMNYYPRPHFELVSEVQRVSSNEWYGFMQFHLYL